MTLPHDIVELFWNVCRGEIVPRDFEVWVEQHLDRLAELLSGDDYALLLETDYSESAQVECLCARLWRLITDANPSFPIEAFGYMASPRKVVRIYVGTCTACGARSPMPSVGSFSYGRFIFTTNSGRYHAYLEAVANPICELIRSIVQQIVGPRLTPDRTGDLLADVVARCADPLAGETFSTHAICPVCHGDRSVYLADRALFSTTIPIASFISFNRLSAEERRRKIVSIIAQLRF